MLFRRRQWQSTPVLLPGKSHGRRSLVGCSPWGCEESDTTEQLCIHAQKKTCCCCRVASGVSDSGRPHRRQPPRLPCPWGSPGKNTGVGCHFLLQCMKVKVKSLSRVRLFATPWTAAYQAPPSMGFSRQEYWSGLPLPSPKEDIGLHISEVD